MTGDTLLGAKCLPSAGAAKRFHEIQSAVSILTFHFSGGGLPGPVLVETFPTWLCHQ